MGERCEEDETEEEDLDYDIAPTRRWDEVEGGKSGADENTYEVAWPFQDHCRD